MNKLGRIASAVVCALIPILLTGCSGYQSTHEVVADLPCTGTRELDPAFFGQPGMRCFMLGGATGHDSIRIIASEGDDFDALIKRGAQRGMVYLVGDGFIATGHTSLLGKAHRSIGGTFH
jgi:hypothetical protein